MDEHSPPRGGPVDDDQDPWRLLARARADLLELQDELAHELAERRRERRSDVPENITETW